MKRKSASISGWALAFAGSVACGGTPEGGSSALRVQALVAEDGGSSGEDAVAPSDGDVATPDAGSPAVDAGAVCERQPPVLNLAPSTSSAPLGTIQQFDLELSNPSSPGCGSDLFYVLGSSIPAGLSVDPVFEAVSLAAGQTAHLTLTAAVSDQAQPGTLPFQYLAVNAADFSLLAAAEASLEATAALPFVRSGCPTAPNQPLAPGGYYVNGNTICTGAGRAHLFHGVDRPSLEWVSSGENLSPADFELMRSWNANVVRIELNQDFWLAASPLSDPDYPSRVDDVVAWAEAAGLDVLLDLHWSDAGVLGGCAPEGGCQQRMPDDNSLQFWRELATRFAGDGRVLFELYNEPHEVSAETWRNGGDTGEGWQAVGMQQLYDAIRETGAENLVVIGGLNWAYDLSVVASQRIAGHNIVYATHPYSDPANPGRPPEDWARAWGWLTHSDPVFVTEFGSLFDPTCATDYGAQVLQYADAHFASWSAWAWYPGGCEFPALIEDWQGTPSPSGAIVRAALESYDDPSVALVP